MKNKKILRVLIPSVVVLALAIGFIAFGAGRSGALTPDAARRPDGVPADGVVIIDPNLTALAGELEGTAESKAAAKAALDEINSTRSAAGLSTLSWSNGLEQASSVRAVEAAQVWSHTRPDGTEYWTVNSNLVYGENLAKGYNSASGAFSAWMASPSHKDNILFGDFRTAAIAVHIDSKTGQWFWANEFGY